jgi:hypothetical protein
MIKHIAAVAVVVTSSVAFAGTENARYELKRIPMGPRPDQYVVVRVDRAPQAERPYALTGDSQDRQVKRTNTRPTPSHPKGTHGQY